MDEAGLGSGPRVVDFDKITSRRKLLMKEDWGKDALKGDPV